MASGFIPPQTWCQTWCLNSWVDAETVGRQDSRFRVSRFNLRRAQSLSQATVEKVEREVEELLEEHRKMVDEVSPESFKSARRSGHDRLHYGAVTGGDLPSLCPPLSQYMRSSNNTVQTALGQPLHHMLPGSQLGYPPQGNTHYRFTHPAVTPDQAFGGVSNDDVTYISNATLKRLDSFHECGHLDCEQYQKNRQRVSTALDQVGRSRLPYPSTSSSQAISDLEQTCREINQDLTQRRETLRRQTEIQRSSAQSNETLETQNPVVIGRQTDQVVSANRREIRAWNNLASTYVSNERRSVVGQFFYEQTYHDIRCGIYPRTTQNGDPDIDDDNISSHPPPGQAPIHVQSGIPGVSLSAPSNPSMQASSRYSTDSVPH